MCCLFHFSKVKYSAFNRQYVQMTLTIVNIYILSGELFPVSGSLCNNTDVLIRANQCTIW